MDYLDWILNTDVKPLGDWRSKPDNKTMRETPSPSLICKDGHHVSIQTGEALYCSPRDNYAPWYEVECGFPSCIPPDSWKPYAEEWSKTLKEKLTSFWWSIKMSTEADFTYKKDGNKYINAIGGAIRGFKRGWSIFIRPVPCCTVYAYIPMELVKEFIEVHGGEDTEASFAQLEPNQP